MAGIAAWLDLVTILAIYLFFGAALYITVVEHPARMQLPSREALRAFQKSYPRAATLQKNVLRTGLLASALRHFKAAPPVLVHKESLQRGHLANIVCSVIILVWTVLFMIPDNNTLMRSQQLSDSQTKNLLQAWGKKHSVRTVLSCFAALALLTAQMGLA